MMKASTAAFVTLFALVVVPWLTDKPVRAVDVAAVALFLACVFANWLAKEVAALRETIAAGVLALEAQAKTAREAECSAAERGRAASWAAAGGRTHI